ncbi:HEXXH motif-containing putative peptide modification protein [Cohnella ginsengisoli]|uniref:HEXXH motif-containing putative peptide modification protein n=1 Tax=Cohnella ginsengisoli TaxID=425004 RepID=A0A9X4QLZ6_9BACL|nr:HEXXH motif-containing putative peptide modification protein [Cohnella ginsengisoli]MDG0790806.1 HEXXH motif-containing putative peptide modification protein [Cohnella ginsengisoli]
MSGTNAKSNFSFLNGDHILSNIDRFIEISQGSPSGEASSTRKERLFASLNALQHSNIPFRNEAILIDFNNHDLLEHLIRDGMLDREDTVSNAHVFEEEDRRIIGDNIAKALSLLQMLQPELHHVMNELIGTIVCFRKPGYGGGSVSSLIGAIWFNPLAKWSVIDYAEALYHEFIHNSLFLDDMVDSVFPDTAIIATEEALVTSTILKIKRPLDRSFHSAAVAIGLMHFYHLLSDYDKISSFKEPLALTISEMNGKLKYLGEQGRIILNEMNQFLKKAGL